MGVDVREWLEAVGLGRFQEVFSEHEIDFDVLPHLSEDDLREIGLPVGARRRLQLAIRELSGTGAPGVGVAASAVASPSPVERRQLTLMFCDLVGSTALSTRVDPEELRAVLVGFQEAVSREVARYGGYVAKFMGDGALAYFGYPDAHEEDAERAIQAGLDIIQAVASPRPGPAGAAGCPPVRIGIATGSVVVGDLIGSGASSL